MTRIRSQTEVRRYFIGGLRCPATDQGVLLSGQIDVEPDVVAENLNRRWYEAITDRMPIGWHVAAVCYATTAILLGSSPWNVLLILLLLFCRGSRRGSSV